MQAILNSEQNFHLTTFRTPLWNLFQQNQTLDMTPVETNVNFKMLSLNVRGIRSLEKRKALLIWLNKQKEDILFLQETYSTKDVENVWRSQWNGSIFFAHGSNHSCGVLVLVKDHLEFEVKSVLTDNKGLYILLNANIQGTDYILGNIYAPNKVQQQCSFF